MNFLEYIKLINMQKIKFLPGNVAKHLEYRQCNIACLESECLIKFTIILFVNMVSCFLNTI